MSENGFKFKGLWWDEKSFFAMLRRVLELHRAISARRVAYHLGVTEKAIRDLIKRSPLAFRLMSEIKTEAVKAGGKAATYREEDFWLTLRVLTGEIGMIYREAKAERERLDNCRREQRSANRISARKAATGKRAQRHEAIQACKREGMTQAATALGLAISLSTVKRCWPEVLTRRPAIKRDRPRVNAETRAQVLKALNTCSGDLSQ